MKIVYFYIFKPELHCTILIISTFFADHVLIRVWTDFLESAFITQRHWDADNQGLQIRVCGKDSISLDMLNLCKSGFGFYARVILSWETCVLLA